MKKAVPVVVLVLLFGGAAWWSMTRSPEPEYELPPPQITPVQPEAVQPLPAPEEAVVVSETEVEPEVAPQPLPELADSDAEVSQDLADIAGTARLADYLLIDQVVSRAVSSIDSLTSRQVPVHINPVRPAEDKFIVETDGDKTVMSEANFVRYDDYVALLRNMDTGQLLAFYRHYSPLFQQAWEQNGGQGSFDDRLLAVIDNLLAAPDPAGPVYLVKPEAVYLFEDPQLEALTAGQKILVRMGPANAAVVKEKLAAVKAALTQ